MLWQVGDATIIDGMPNGVGGARRRWLAAGGEDCRPARSPLYAFVMLIGVVALVSIFLVFR